VDLVELEVLEGIRPFAKLELARRLAAASVVGAEKTSLLIEAPGDRLEQLLALRTVVAAHLVRRFPIPRPRGFLGDAHLRGLVALTERVRGLHHGPAFQGFRFGAAGSDSAVFRKLAAEVAARTGLDHRPRDGELLLRFRPATAGSGWEVLARLGPRPLSTRAWRRRDMPGALNATIAAAMVELAMPAPGDRFVNLLCGSGTILIERLLRAPAALAIGIEIDPEVLALTTENLAAAELATPLLRTDARRLPLPERSVDSLAADLPYGTRSGSHAANLELYSRLLAEAARVSVRGGRLVLITHDIRRFDQALAGSLGWHAEKTFRVFQKGLRPQVWLLRRL
jgi:23S rRNA G2445 N2-methylase RlmL